MLVFDLVLIIFLGLFILYGFYIGATRMILSLFSAILSIIIAVNIFLDVYNWVSFIGFGSESLGKTITFILVLIIVHYLLSIVFKIVAKVLKIITSLPVISLINRFLGGAIGLVKGLFILGIIIFVMSSYALSNELLSSLVIDSDIAPILIESVNWVSPLIPSALEAIESSVIIG
jgi:membrane protein required for colicin V production